MGVCRLLLDDCCFLSTSGDGRESLRNSGRLGATSGPRLDPVIFRPVANQSAIANQEGNIM